LAVAAMALAFAVGSAGRFVIDWFERRPAAVVATPMAVLGQVKGSSTGQLGGAFTLVDHRGRTLTDQDFRGAFMFVYFGYTFCPDICPTELQSMSEALDALGPLAKRVQPIFVTIDPERDTVAVLADYVANFHPRMVGLTGTPAQVAVVAKAYGVFYGKVSSNNPEPGMERDEDYLMSHSSFVYLMDPEGRRSAAFPAGTAGTTMAKRIGSEVREHEEKEDRSE
jgi:protein SCO1/2